MKSIKKDDVIKRVSDSESERFIKAGWSYISKTEWREKRPVTKKTTKAGKNKE